jgi:ribonuclease E
MGLLVRTEAEGRAEEAIIEDLEVLQKQWEAIQQEANSTRAPALLNRDDDFIQRVLRDMYTADVNRIVVDSHTGVKRVKQHLVNWSGGRSPEGVLIDHHRDRLLMLTPVPLLDRQQREKPFSGQTAKRQQKSPANCACVTLLV